MEYRICWSAFSNAQFHGATEWEDAVDLGATHDEIADALNRCADGAELISMPVGLEEAIDASGFEWRVETRS